MSQSSNITCSCAGTITAQATNVSPTVVNNVIRHYLEPRATIAVDEIIVVSGRFVRIFVYNYRNQWQTACGFSLDQAINNLATD